MFCQIMVQFGDVESFLHCNEDIAPVTKVKLLNFSNHNEKRTLNAPNGTAVIHPDEKAQLSNDHFESVFTSEDLQNLATI